MADTRSPVLLLVDDEASILNALRRCLRREGYRILTANSPIEGLRLIESESVDAVLSDHKMPGMDGIEFLGEVRRRSPRTARLMISGWSDAVAKADLEAVGVLSVLPKPWDDAVLKKTLREATRRPATPSASAHGFATG